MPDLRFPLSLIRSLLLPLMVGAVGAAGVQAQSAEQPVELIVRVDDGEGALQVALEDASRAAEAGRRLPQAEARGAQAVRPLVPETARSRPPRFADRVFVLTYPDSAAWRAGRAAWQEATGVGYVQGNEPFRLDQAVPSPLATEPLGDSLAYLSLIRAPEAWSQTRGAGVTIGLLDTGLDLDHPDFAGRLWQNPGEIPGNGLDDDGNGYADDVVGYDFVDRPESVEPGDYRERDADPSEDGTGNEAHGTLVAGVLAAGLNGAGVAGVAPEAEIVVLRAFGRDGIAQDDDVAAALVYAADMRVQVVNASFGRRRSTPLLEEAIRYAASRGTVVVASAGNAGGDAPHYPSDYPDVISVVWLAEDGLGLAGGLTGGAQYGPGVDLGAPATGVYTTRVPLDGDARPDEAKRYGRVSGSSFAAPQVAGAAALLRALDRSLSPASVRGILTATALDIGEPGWDTRTGAGRLDVAGALGLPYPTDVTLLSPRMDGGASAGTLAIVGSALAPQFRWWRVERAPLALGETGPDPAGPWQVLAGPETRQVRADTLARWDVSEEPEGEYLVRLVAGLSSGRTLEDRRRVQIDRTPPALGVRYLGPAYADGRVGLQVEADTDDFTRLRLRVAGEPAIPSDDLAPRHGIFWPNETGRSGPVDVELEATNRAGLITAVSATVGLPEAPLNTALATTIRLDVPAGYLLDQAPDFDGDGLLEIVLNQYQDGWLGDTLSIYEWAGDGFRKVRQDATFGLAGLYEAQAFPRDAGDTDGDDRGELLLQVGPSTFLLEAAEPGAYPSRLLYADTTGASSGQPFWGARLTDLDGDGQGEILAHDLGNADGPTRWLVRERSGDQFPPTETVSNPSGVSGEETANQLEDPYAALGDFDGDGRADFVSGDADGDVVVYESCGDDCLEAVFVRESDRSHAGRRFAVGDFDGDGQETFVTFTSGYEAAETDDAPFGIAAFWASTGDDAYRVVDSLAFHGSSSRHGAMTAADLDGDGRDELVAVHPPSLWVFGWTGERFEARFHDRNAPSAMPGYRSIRLVAADFDADGRDEVVATAADGHLYLLDGEPGAQPPPRWRAAHAWNADEVLLAWDAAGADSVAVLVGAAGEPLDEVATTTGDTLLVTVGGRRDVALLGYREGKPLGQSPRRTVEAYPLGALLQAEATTPGSVRLRFSRALDPTTPAAAFRLGDRRPDALLLAEAGRVAILSFDPLPAGSYILTAEGLRDADGAPILPAQVEVDVPAARVGELLLESWAVVGGQEAVLTFSEALDAEAARDLSAYRLDGPGRVASASLDADDPRQLRLSVTEVLLGATGQRVTLVVERMRSVTGATLSAEGAAATLTAAALSLGDVFVYPNPHRAAEHSDGVTVGGLPAGARIEILTLAGQRVRSLVESGGDGGVTWDLRDEGGARVAPGVYLVRASLEEGGATLVKLALIR